MSPKENFRLTFWINLFHRKVKIAEVHTHLQRFPSLRFLKLQEPPCGPLILLRDMGSEKVKKESDYKYMLYTLFPSYCSSICQSTTMLRCKQQVQGKSVTTDPTNTFTQPSIFSERGIMEHISIPMFLEQ